MKNNIFNDAKFGDEFITRDGSKVMYVHYFDDIDAYRCVLENWYKTLDYAPDGKAFIYENHPTDIISRYEEPNDELTICCENCKWGNLTPCNHDTGVGRHITECFVHKNYAYKECIDEEKLNELAYEYSPGEKHMDMAERRDFKAGYRKAMEEK